jgi:hypothetical protein
VAWSDTLPIREPAVQKDDEVRRLILVNGAVQLAEPIDPKEGEALDLTHDDDVVSSSWWERRVGYRPVSPEEIARGSTRPEDVPASSGPLRITDLKTQGVTPGFTIEDVNGHRYIVKLDAPDYPHLSSAAGVVTNRLMWGAGFFVPQDYVMAIDPARLVPDPKAKIVVGGVKRPITQADIARLLAHGRPIDGRYYVVASLYVTGVPRGSFFFEGRRHDDPNDHYDHEHRRELRGLAVISAWVNNEDMREGNTIDAYMPGGWLRHYVIDFNSALGNNSTRPKHPKDDAEHPLAPYQFALRWASLGLYHRAWEDADSTLLSPSLGYLPSETFDPEHWRPSDENTAFADMTSADAYWAAKIVAGFTDEMVRAAVAQGALPTRADADTLARRIEIRRDRTVAYWFGRVSTVEQPHVDGGTDGALRLAFRDLGLERGLWAPAATTYAWRFEDPARGRSGAGAGQARTGAPQLLDVSWRAEGTTAPRSGADQRPLATLRLTTLRPGIDPQPATIFLRWDGSAYQVVGVAHGDPRK